MNFELEPQNQSLEFDQKTVLDLKQTKPKDRTFKADQERIKRITSQPGYADPVIILVENTSDQDIKVDGVEIKKGAVGNIFPWQLRALVRWLTPINAAELASRQPAKQKQ